jgi:hypothetical protein
MGNTPDPKKNISEKVSVKNIRSFSQLNERNSQLSDHKN